MSVNITVAYKITEDRESIALRALSERGLIVRMDRVPTEERALEVEGPASSDTPGTEEFDALRDLTESILEGEDVSFQYLGCGRSAASD